MDLEIIDYETHEKPPIGGDYMLEAGGRQEKQERKMAGTGGKMGKKNRERRQRKRIVA